MGSVARHASTPCTNSDTHGVRQRVGQQLAPAASSAHCRCRNRRNGSWVKPASSGESSTTEPSCPTVGIGSSWRGSRSPSCRRAPRRHSASVHSISRTWMRGVVAPRRGQLGPEGAHIGRVVAVVPLVDALALLDVDAEHLAAELEEVAVQPSASPGRGSLTTHSAAKGSPCRRSAAIPFMILGTPAAPPRDPMRRCGPRARRRSRSPGPGARRRTHTRRRR